MPNYITPSNFCEATPQTLPFPHYFPSPPYFICIFLPTSLLFYYMDLSDKQTSLKFESSKQIKQANPFLKCCGNFSTVIRSEAPKGRVIRKKTKITMTMFGTVLEKLREMPLPLPLHFPGEVVQEEEDEFVKKVLRGEKRQLLSRFPFGKRCEEMFLTVKSKGEFVRNRVAVGYSSESRPTEVKEVRQYNTSFQEQPKKEVIVRNPQKQRPSPCKSPQKQKLPSISPQKLFKPVRDRRDLTQSVSPQKQKPPKIQQLCLSRPILPYNQKQLSHIKAQTYVVIQHPSMQTILAHHPRLSVEIASLTKIMTFYVVIKIAQEKGIDINKEMVEVHPHFEEVSGTSAELVEGDIYTVEQLLYGLMLPSGNDAAVCLADWGGKLLTNKTDIKETVKAFVLQMNKTAKALGLKDSRYGNPHGLPHTQSRSTAADLCKLVSLCLHNKLFSQVISTRQYKISIPTTSPQIHRQVQWQNTNKLLRRPNFIGVKTGITVTAGPCLAAGYVFRNKTYVVVLLRTNKISRRFKETRKILYWSLRSLCGELAVEEREVLEALKRNRREFDSDNSEDQQEFVYSNGSSSEYAKRTKILKYQL